MNWHDSQGRQDLDPCHTSVTLPRDPIFFSDLFSPKTPICFTPPSCKTASSFPKQSPSLSLCALYKRFFCCDHSIFSPYKNHHPSQLNSCLGSPAIRVELGAFILLTPKASSSSFHPSPHLTEHSCWANALQHTGAHICVCAWLGYTCTHNKDSVFHLCYPLHQAQGWHRVTFIHFLFN